MSNGSVLAAVRKQMMTSGHSEHEVLADGGGLAAVFDQMQDLRNEMNEAKRAAVKKVEEEYAEAFTKLEKRYAMLAKLSATDSQK